MKSRQAALVVFIGAVAGILLVVPFFAQGVPASQEAPLPILGTVSSFSLDDSRGEFFSRTFLDGSVWVADFITTSCTDVCPAMTGKMAALQRLYRDQPDVHFVSISVDPENDTPEVLAGYAEAHGANTSQWHFLTGPLETIRRTAAEGFKLGPIEDPQAYSTRFVLVDRNRRIRGYYESGDEPAIARLSQDIALLLNEIRL